MFEDRMRRWRFRRLNSVCGDIRKAERLMGAINPDLQPIETQILATEIDTMRRRESRLRSKLS